MLDQRVITANLEMHKQTPQVSTTAHVYGLMAAAAQDIAEKKILYLDTRFWVYLRNAEMGKPRYETHREMLRLLRKLVAEGKVVCPISDALCVELFKQADPQTKLLTARLMDELSGGVTLIGEYSRIGEEIAACFERRVARSANDGICLRVWARPCFAYGARVPHSPQFDAETNRLFQKTAIDTLWSMSVEDWVVSQLGATPEPNPMLAAADVVNARRAKYANEIRSFEQARLAEIAGGLRVFKDRIAGAYDTIMRGDVRDRRSNELRAAQLARIHKVLLNLFRYRGPLMAANLPGIYIHASCHAAMRWDRTRKVNDHDLLDFHHATGAVPYCDAFFTDRPMQALLTSGPLQLDVLFGTTVESDEAKILEYLETSL